MLKLLPKTLIIIATIPGAHTAIILKNSKPDCSDNSTNVSVANYDLNNVTVLNAKPKTLRADSELDPPLKTN